MAWAEYYRQQAAYYGQTLGQAQAHSQVCIPGPRGSFPRGAGCVGLALVWGLCFGFAR